MRLSRVSNLIAHAGFKHKGMTILQFSVQLAFETQEDMPLRKGRSPHQVGRKGVLNTAGSSASSLGCC